MCMSDSAVNLWCERIRGLLRAKYLLEQLHDLHGSQVRAPLPREGAAALPYTELCDQRLSRIQDRPSSAPHTELIVTDSVKYQTNLAARSGVECRVGGTGAESVATNISGVSEYRRLRQTHEASTTQAHQ